MGLQGVLALVVLAGCVARCAAAETEPYQYALNYGAELSEIEKRIPLRDGLAWGVYAKSCPSAESIIQQRVAALLQQDQGLAAGLVRLFFHDCFVQGCDGSILLKLAGGSELNAPPNQTIRKIALQLVDDVKARLEQACPKTVSCADIVVLSAKVAIQQVGGPTFNVPLGRKDSLAFSQATTDLPSPFTTFAQQSSIFTKKGLNTADLVALAGAHTLGVAHCGAFVGRLLPTIDPKMSKDYANYLIKNVCPTTSSTNSTGLDFYTPNHFDNQYFKNLPTGGALLPSDQNLDQDATAWNLVKNWANNQQGFFNQFIVSYIKMSQLSSPGNVGEIRNKCSTTNSGKLNEPVLGDEPKVDLRLTTPTYAGLASEPELISMVTDGSANF